jgi:predicted TIM-barrel fold metal-dependent hydrolase
MQRIDTHLHLWDATRFDYSWHHGGLFSELPDTYVLDDAIAEAGAADTAFIVVQAEVDHANDPVEETAWMQRTVDTHPKGRRIAGFVGYADLSQPKVEDILERHARHSVFVGIRQEIWWEKPSPRPDVLEIDLLANAAWRRGFGALADVNASFDLTCWHSQRKRPALVL